MSERTPTLPELFISNKNSLLLSQVQVNNHSTPGNSTTKLGNKHLRHQLPLNNDSKTINLVQIACAPETS
jgi:hypothetical protein